MRLLTLLALLLLSSCAAFGLAWGKKTNEWLPTWIGVNIDEFIVQGAVPNSIIEVTDGRKVYTFRNEWTFDGNYQFCQYTFVTDSEGVILSNKWSGYCP
jgi:hypothetical protein